MICHSLPYKANFLNRLKFQNFSSYGVLATSLCFDGLSNVFVRCTKKNPSFVIWIMYQITKISTNTPNGKLNVQVLVQLNLSDNCAHKGTQ